MSPIQPADDVKAMEAMHAMDCAQWRDAVDPAAAAACSAAVDALASFPVLDATVQRVIALCDDPETTVADLVAQLEADASFSANLLRFANSAACATPIRAKTIRQAVMLVGRRALRRLALEATTFRFLERAGGTGGASCGQLHLHAISVAMASSAAAQAASIGGDAAHLGGLLHDIGRLVLPRAFGVERCDAVARTASSSSERVLAERAAFGIDHAQAGALLAQRWNLPADVVYLIAMHHGGPTGVASPTADVACVQVADAVVDMLGGEEPEHVLVESALGRLELQADLLDRLALAIAPTTTTPIVAQGGLARKVSDLERLSQTDDLTGLANRRHWLQTVRGALSERGSGTVLVVDVEHIDVVIDRHGPAVGDLVLTEVARVLSRHGHTGRLGRDEFGVWIERPPADAEAVAALIVGEVAESFSDYDGPRVDVSIGVATAPANGSELAEVLETADAALHAAKRAGRSRVVVAPEDGFPGSIAA
jgi:diguanylate cyclase (GGDEF)-like protein/putative nucleotidyltransferase with HDIG domain